MTYAESVTVTADVSDTAQPASLKTRVMASVAAASPSSSSLSAGEVSVPESPEGRVLPVSGSSISPLQEGRMQRAVRQAARHIAIFFIIGSPFRMKANSCRVAGICRVAYCVFQRVDLLVSSSSSSVSSSSSAYLSSSTFSMVVRITVTTTPPSFVPEISYSQLTGTWMSVSPSTG